MLSSMRLRSAVGLGLAGALLLALSAMPAAAAAEADVTFTKDVAPIFHRSCANCHKPGSIAPMSLLTYEDARPWARSIRDKVSRPDDDPERMPPWFIEKNVGIQKFKDDLSLSRDEVATIAAWVDGGAPSGDPADMPEYELAGREWTIGTPDLI
ncbi:MAG: cytochrome c, partial [Acidobacteria bacterium]|nr:cytochrome c [Acidobacteriota bacterium]